MCDIQYSPIARNAMRSDGCRVLKGANQFLLQILIPECLSLQCKTQLHSTKHTALRSLALQCKTQLHYMLSDIGLTGQPCWTCLQYVKGTALCMYSETVRHSESKERLDKVCTASRSAPIVVCCFHMKVAYSATTREGPKFRMIHSKI